MLSYILVLIVAVAALAVPQSRKAALSVLGVAGIASLAILGIGVPVWALYEAKSLLISPETVVAEDSSKGSKKGALVIASGESEDSVPADERAERESADKEQQRQAEEQQRIARIAAAARAVVEKDRKYAAAAAASPPLPGLAQVSTDLIAIRVPSWRDAALAAREQALIRTWLHSIGLTPEETASIYTASGWGSVYELWRAEVLADTDGLASDVQPAQATVSQQPVPGESVPDQPEQEPALLQAERPLVDEPRALFEPLAEPIPEPAQERGTPPRETPKRRSSQQPAVGPFGY